MSVAPSSVSDVSDETKRILDEATASVTAQRKKVEARKQECLDAVADGIPAAIERLARGVAHTQPEVTKGLGALGLKALREELAAEAAVLAAYVRAGSVNIKWPRRDSEWSTVEPRKIHSALFAFMYGTPVNRVGNVFDRHGYDVRRTDRSGAQGLVLPQSLYHEDSFGEVAKALNDLGTAEIALAKARAEDDKDAINSLWDEA